MIFLSLGAKATTEYLGVNHFLRQYCIFESGGVLGWYEPIGWSYYGDAMEMVDRLKHDGYTQTQFPYLIELYGVILVCLLCLLLMLYKFWKKGV